MRCDVDRADGGSPRRALLHQMCGVARRGASLYLCAKGCELSPRAGTLVCARFSFSSWRKYAEMPRSLEREGE